VDELLEHDGEANALKFVNREQKHPKVLGQDMTSKLARKASQQFMEGMFANSKKTHLEKYTIHLLQ